MTTAASRQWVLTADDGAVRVATLNRPDARNALNASLIEALYTSLCEADDDFSVRAVVLTGADPAFWRVWISKRRSTLAARYAEFSQRNRRQMGR